jgi:hypothetical protein
MHMIKQSMLNWPCLQVWLQPLLHGISFIQLSLLPARRWGDDASHSPLSSSVGSDGSTAIVQVCGSAVLEAEKAVIVFNLFALEGFHIAGGCLTATHPSVGLSVCLGHPSVRSLTVSATT